MLLNAAVVLFQIPYQNQQSTTSQAPHTAQNNKTRYLRKARRASPDKSLRESLTSANFNRNQRTTFSLEFHYSEHESHQIHRFSSTHHYRIISGCAEKAAELNPQFRDRERARLPFEVYWWVSITGEWYYSTT